MDKSDKRAELEERAINAGVKFSPRIGDEALNARVLEAENSMEEEVNIIEVSEAEELEREELSLRTSEPVRKKAPRMTVAGINEDSRAAMIDKHERLDPECKYVFQSSRATDEELRAKGLERTGHRLKNDILCRTIKESFEEYQEAKNVAQFESMKSIDKHTTGSIVAFHEARAKKPRTE